MSNGDDVLDNWEEFDEANLHSALQRCNKALTQDFDNSSNNTEKINTFLVINKTDSYSSSFNTSRQNNSLSSAPSSSVKAQQPQMKLLQRPTNAQDSSVANSSPATPILNQNFTKSPLDNMAATFEPVMMVLHKPADEYDSANYTQPIVNQTVKILRRPTQSSEPRNNGIRPKQPIKTLKQREQEYAEARLRILGSAKNPEDEEQRACSSPTVATSGSSSTVSAPGTPIVAATPMTTVSFPTTPINVGAPSKINSPKTQGGAAYNHFQYQQQQQQQQQQQYQQPQQPPPPQQQQQYHPNYQQQNFYYNQQPQSPAYNNNNRTFSNMPPLLGYQPHQPPSQMKMSQQYHKSSQLQKQQQQQQQQTWSPVVGGSVSASLRQTQNENLLRLPKGPDGTIGFQMRR